MAKLGDSFGTDSFGGQLIRVSYSSFLEQGLRMTFSHLTGPEGGVPMGSGSDAEVINSWVFFIGSGEIWRWKGVFFLILVWIVGFEV